MATPSVFPVRKLSDVTRVHSASTANVLSNSRITLTQLAMSFYSAGLIDINLQTYVIEEASVLHGAESLLRHAQMKVEQDEACFALIVSLMSQHTVLNDVVKKMEQSVLELKDGTEPRTIEYSACDVNGFPGAAQQHAEKMIIQFESLLHSIATLTDIKRFKLCLISCLSYLLNNPPALQNILHSIEQHIHSTNDIVEFLREKNLINYLNIQLLVHTKDVIGNPWVTDQIEEYKQQYNTFARSNFCSLNDLFKMQQRFTPMPISSLPEVSVELALEQWKTRSLYQWNETLQNIADWPDYLLLKDISINRAVIICYYVMPFFLSKVVRELTEYADRNIHQRLADEGACFIISPEVLVKGKDESKWLQSKVEEAIKHSSQHETRKCSSVNAPLDHVTDSIMALEQNLKTAVKINS